MGSVNVNGWDLDFVVKGEPASAKNSRRIILRGKHPRLIKSKKALDYCRIFELQCPVLPTLIDCDVALRLDVYYQSRRPDLAAMDLCMDLLQGRIIKNDRCVKASQSIWNLDKKNPRTRIRIRKLEVESSLGLSSFPDSEIWGSVI